MDLVVSIVVYRAFESVLPAIESVKKSARGHSTRIVIIDNSGSDEYFRKFSEHFKRDRIVTVLQSKTNGGYGAGNNQALAFKAKYHLVMNPDIIVPAGVIKKLLRYMESHRDIAILAPREQTKDGTKRFLCRHYPAAIDFVIARLPRPLKKIFRKRIEWYEMRDRSYDNEIEMDWASGAFLFMRQEFFRTCRFDEGFFLYLEDIDLCRRMHEYGRVVYYPQAAVTHEWSHGSHQNVKLFLAHVRSIIRYFNKWGWKLL